MTKKVYQAGTIMSREDRGKPWREKLKIQYPSIDWQDPFSNEGDIDINEAHREKYNGEIVNRDIELLKQSDELFLWYEYGEETWGTPIELWIAKQNDIDVWVYKNTPEMLESPFLHYTAYRIKDDLDELIKFIK